MLVARSPILHRRDEDSVNGYRGRVFNPLKTPRTASERPTSGEVFAPNARSVMSRNAFIAAVALSLAATSVASAQAPAKPDPATVYTGGATLKLVAAFPTQQITGLAVAHNGRVFVNLPRWTVDVPISVGEVVNGKIVPYPNAEWNAYRNRMPMDTSTHFVCVQSVVFDEQGNLWVLDPASPATEGPKPHGAKLVEIDIGSNRVKRVVPFDMTVAIPGSYLNDVRFSPDGRFAYMTDSGVRGSLVVADLGSGRSWRVLDGDPSTQMDMSVVIHTDGHELRRPDGRQPEFAADGIALSPDGHRLFWQATTGKTLYSIPTAVLQDQDRAGSAAEFVKTVQITHPADGLWIDALGRLFVTDPGQNSVEMTRPGAPLQTLVQDPRLRWPDTFSQGRDGAIYVTTSHIQDSPWFKPLATVTPSEIWKLEPK